VNDPKELQRTALVTGGSSGVGLAVAEALGKRGYKLWIAGRSSEKGAAAVARLRPHCPAGVEFLPLDVTLFAAIEQFVRALKPQLDGRLDTLVHSVGVVNVKRVVSADGLEEGWATQFLGRYLLTEAFTPELSNADDGRVVFVSARAPKKPHLYEDDPSLAKNFTFMRATRQNQSACVLYEQTYAAEHPNGPAINGATPGIVKNTGISRSLPSLIRVIGRGAFAILGTATERAATNLVALASDPALKGVSGFYFPQPQNIAIRQKLAYEQNQLESLHRVVDRYAEFRRTLLTPDP
jgi:NAD(P)-dependent dehydrogenase (short-subunit alcohol dehydrogenase family)